MSIATEITRLQTAKADLKTAIEAKGVTVGDITLDGYAAKVAEIPTGGTFPETPDDALLFYSTNEIGLSIYNKTKNWDGTLYYSTDHTNWSEWDGTTTLTSAKTGEWHLLYLRGVGNTKITGSGISINGRFVVNGSGVKCIGNCNNLLDYTNTPTLGAYAFAGLFRENVTVDFDVTLPSMTLSERCYDQLFYGCTSLVTAPSLPATTLTAYCYTSMFSNCILLKTAPVLSSTSLANYCYSYMFSGCTSLVTAPVLPALSIPNNGYSGMFANCTSLVTAPELPATAVSQSGYESMFNGCTSLVTAPPSLRALYLSFYTYRSMFSKCVALTAPPAIYFISGSMQACQNMFFGCTSLSVLPALTLLLVNQTDIYSSMFQNCTNIKLSTEQTGDYQTEYRIPTAGTGSVQSDAMRNMFAGTGGTFKGAPTINTTYYTSNTVIYPTRTVTIVMTGDCPQIGGDVYDGADTTGTYLGNINDGTTFNITSGHIYIDLGVYSDQYYNGATATNGITVTTDTAGAIGATVGLDGTLTINTYEH